MANIFFKRDISHAYCRHANGHTIEYNSHKNSWVFDLLYVSPKTILTITRVCYHGDPACYRLIANFDSCDVVKNALYGAARGGQDWILDDVSKKYAFDWNYVLRNASAEGRLNVVQQAIQLGADDLRSALWYALSSEQKELLMYFKRIVPDFNNIASKTTGIRPEFVNEILDK